MYLRVSLTDRCNLRCTYCLPERARFARREATTGELLRLVSLVVDAARVHKIRITGGEPALAPDLIAHVRHARQLVDVVGLSSNGLLLEPLLPALRAAGLNRLNISLDAVDTEGFRRIARRDGLEKVVDAIRAAARLGFEPLKVNAVALAETDFPGLVRFARAEGVHLRFIELMEIGEARAFHAGQYVSAAQMRERIASEGIRLVEANDLDEPTSRVWTIEGADRRRCTVGFITTVSQPFCATCDRLRLSARGRLHTCLSDERGWDLLTALRSDGEGAVRELVRRAVVVKKPPPRLVRLETMAAIGG